MKFTERLQSLCLIAIFLVFPGNSGQKFPRTDEACRVNNNYFAVRFTGDETEFPAGKLQEDRFEPALSPNVEYSKRASGSITENGNKRKGVESSNKKVF